jgi:predicted Zn-dependent peptidase
MNFKKTILKNGLRIITVPMKGTETVTVVVMVGVGSRYETDKEAGLSHFIEHMFFKGTKKRKNTLAISSELDGVGGDYNAFTGKDFTAYYAKVDAKHFDTALDVISDIYLNSKIDPKEIEKEKGTILQEISMYEDLPMNKVYETFEGLLYKKNSLGREVIGSKKTVSSFQRKDFIDYMKRFYLANDTIVCVAGKINEKKSLEKISNYFSKSPKGKKPEIKKVTEDQKFPEMTLEFKETDQTHLILGNRAYHENHEDRFILSLLSIILGGNMSSRMFIEVREKLGLTYYISTSVEVHEDCGHLSTRAGVKHEKLELAVKTILEEYKKISGKKVSEKELQRAKDFIKGKYVMGFEASDEVAMFFIDQAMKREKIMTMQEIFEQIDKVTPEDILRVAKDIFKNNKLNLAIIGPHKNPEKLKKILKLS